MSREDETKCQFRVGSEPARRVEDETRSLNTDAAGEGRRYGEPLAKVCSACGQPFSGDARFCPFDGEPLGLAGPWDTGSDPLLGSVVDGRYEIKCVLGEGGMGRVYRARHGALGRSFALKVLKPDLASDSALAARFTREAKAAASVSSPYVVQITDFGALASGQPFFVMELLEGRSLSQLIHERGPLSAAEVVKIARPVAEGLDAAHAARIIHRDLKPDNVHVDALDTETPMVKVLDFGLAKVAGSSKLTRDGMVFGTPHYMSPEQAAGETLDHRVDVYSLGVVMYEMATGRTPFEADTYMGVLTQHLHIIPTRPSVLLGHDSLGALEDIILRCLAKRPAQRFDGMDELVRELRRFERAPDVPFAVPLLRIAREPGRARVAERLQAQTESLKHREQSSAPPPNPPPKLRPEAEHAAGHALAGDGVALRSPLSWVIAVGSVVSVVALLYLLAASWDTGPTLRGPRVTSTARLSAAAPSSPPSSVTPSSRLASPIVSAPDQLPEAAARLASTETVSTPPNEVGPAAAASPARASGSPHGRPVVLSPRLGGRAWVTPRRPSASEPNTPQPEPSAPEPPPPANKLPTLSGGDIIDPWAQ